MNEFLQQFLLESRELVVQATEGVLLLERSPHDAQCLDAVFRAFHTLKGGAGIVEFAMMERAVHATETLLTEVRSGKRAFNPQLVGDCLASLDRVSAWLDQLEQTGELPTDAMRPEGGPAGEAPPSPGQRELKALAADLKARHPSTAAQARAAFRYKPAADCFYKGEDPIARIATWPRLLALEIGPASPWQPLDQLDPYLCNVILIGLTACGSTEAAAHLQGNSGQYEVASFGEADMVVPGSLPKMVRDVLEEQMALLEDVHTPGAAGRLGSAALTAANAMRFCGREPQAEMLALAAQESVAEGSPQRLKEAIARMLAAKPAAATPAPEAPQRKEAARTLRIDAERIDALVRLTGELTVAKNAIGHTAKLAQRNGDSTAALLKDHHGILERLVAQLQSSVIGMRVLPLLSVFQRFPRVLREMSASLGKPAELRFDGEDTEADKAIVEMLFEPLVHVVRNAIDHGIENGERRRALGKPAVGTILMRAARNQDQVLIEVCDDGAGVDVGRVRQVAKDRQVATEAELGVMTETEVLDLVFAPGFSTAARVTEISGRGVGMDAVRSAVESVGGRVSIASRTGEGTTVTLSLPFSVMMTQVMTVEAAGQMFGLPLDVVVETIRVPQDRLSGVGDARVLVHRQRTIPVVELAGMVGAAGKSGPLAGDEATVIIATAAGQMVGIQVERAGERMEVILKPLDGLLSGTPGIAGTTVLGDGRVLLVLNIAEMLE